MPIAQARTLPFILNDRRSASELDCDGVHIGQDDLLTTCSKNRRAEQSRRSPATTRANLALEAGEPVPTMLPSARSFPTATKAGEDDGRDRNVQWWAEIMEVPCRRDRRHHKRKRNASD